GLNDVGGSAAVLLPVNWYSELIGQYLRGEGENAEFNSPSPSDGVGVGHWKNLWDLSDALTMEVGASFAHGKNALGGHTALYGSDLTFKWRPVIGGKYRSWILAGEYLRRELEQPGTAEETGDGWNVWGSYQFAERWSAAVRYDYLRVDGSSADEVLNPNGLENGTTRKYSAGVTFKPSEFSMFRIEYNQAEGPASAHGETVENKIYLQAGFVIGSHPPHTY
ncbi:MAG: outer membrane beta-barrel protein, partial [Bdellovibrionales bacterium]